MKQKEPILVSACLLGRACRYDGASRPHPAVEALAAHPDLTLIPICPECDGGLPTPRIPAERVGERVVNRAGEDVTAAYRRGAELACRTAREKGCRFSVLKERSPSCGSHEIYDGSFTGKRKKGRGVCSEMLEKAGIAVFSEEETELLLATIFEEDDRARLS